MNQAYLSSDEMKDVLNKLNEDYTSSSVEEIENIILETYRVSQDVFRRHPYSAISEYVTENEDLVLIFQNLDRLINSKKPTDSNSIKVAYKIRDHLEMDDERAGKIGKMQVSLDYARKELEEMRELKKEVDINTKQNKANLTTIKETQGNIMKEAVAISSVIVTILGFLLTNAGILRVIGDAEFVGNDTNILKLLLQVNASMAIGLSTLMMVAAAFIHKGNEDYKFWKTAKFIVPLCIIITSVIVIIVIQIFSS